MPHQKRILFKLKESRQIQHLGDLNLSYRKIRVSKILFRPPSASSGKTRSLLVSLSGFNDNISVVEGDYRDHRNYFFALPIGEGEFVSYVNRETDSWDYVSDSLRHWENQMDIRIFLDNQPFTPAVDEEVYLEIEFCS